LSRMESFMGKTRPVEPLAPISQSGGSLASLNPPTATIPALRLPGRARATDGRAG
jgi:hypothetical protein